MRFPCAESCQTVQAQREKGLKRLHFSCFRCADRRAKRGHLRGCHFNRYLGLWLPDKRREVSAIWYDQDAELLPAVYILYIDEQRRFRAVKDVLLNQLWKWAIANNRKERAWLLRRLVTICEFLAS